MADASSRTASQVAIYGGGIAGALLAKRLSMSAAVTLIDPNDYFEVPMSVPRSIVEPGFADQALMPFRVALPLVNHVRGRLVELADDAGTVTFHDGGSAMISARINVLATGNAFANPLVRAIESTTREERHAFFRTYNNRLGRARSILIVGGGPIGVEIAGEISERYPNVVLTILESGERILAGTSIDAARRAASFLTRKGVTIITDDRVDAIPSDAFAPPGTSITQKGRRIDHDLLIWATGGRPNTAYMKTNFADVLDASGRIRVSSDLRVAGCDTLFAIGDITDLDENKMAWHIGGQVDVAAHNIETILRSGPDASRGLKRYKAKTGNPAMAVTLGSRNGVVHLPGVGIVTWGPLVRAAKARHMLVPKYRRSLGFGRANGLSGRA